MIVADTSALLSLATVDLLSTFLREFDVHTTKHVRTEVEDTSEYTDRHGAAADSVLAKMDRMTLHQVMATFESARIDAGEATCGVLTREIDAEFLITDDLRALPELQTVVDAQVAISPIVLKALVTRGVLNHDAAVQKVDDRADRRDWLGAPIYRRARTLFE